MSSKKKKESKKGSASGGSGGSWPSPGSGVATTPLPDPAKSRLWELFGAIEREFEQLHADNAALRDRLDKLELLSEKDRGSADNTADSANISAVSGTMETPQTTLPLRIMKIKSNNRGPTITQRLMTYTPSKKSRSTLSVETSQVCVFAGPRDGIWDIAHTHTGPPLIGAASADGIVTIWDVESGHPIQKYTGHIGSVNGLSFHPSDTLCSSVSGDTSLHIWTYTATTHLRQRNSSNPMDRAITKHDSSGEERNLSDEDPTVDAPPVAMVKQPIRILSEHKAPVMACDWLADGRQLVTASWDHTAKLWDAESGHVIHSLEGHDQELTHVCAHPTQQLLVTSSTDTTFRLWDFRAPPIHSVNVFQGHSKAVNSTVFSLRENVVSASDDHSLKIWDLRNMRSPLDSVRLDCGINRISVSHGNRPILAVPLDNRHIKLYDITAARLAHLPWRQRQGHHRMVCSVTWSHDSHMTTERCNLFSAGFDNKIVGWKVKF